MTQRTYIWLKIRFKDDEEKWYCVSRVLRESLLMEKTTNRFWKNKMIGNYITVSTTEYYHNRTRLTVGKIIKINLSHHGTGGSNWTRNQFVTPEHLLNFRDAYNYLKHDYSWYNRLAIWCALFYWHNELLQQRIKKNKKKLRKKRWQVNHFGYQFNRKLSGK